MNDLIKKLEERKTALLAQSDKSEDIAELKAIQRNLSRLTRT